MWSSRYDWSMSEYRQAPPPTALILFTKDELFAVEPDTGALFWRANVPDLRRLLRIGDTLFAVAGKGVSLIDAASGKALREVKLAFCPSAGLVSGERLFVAGPEGAAALTAAGDVLWSVGRETQGVLSMRQLLACRSADGIELRREVVAIAGDRANPGLMLGEQVAQPDFDVN